MPPVTSTDILWTQTGHMAKLCISRGESCEYLLKRIQTGTEIWAVTSHHHPHPWIWESLLSSFWVGLFPQTFPFPTLSEKKIKTELVLLRERSKQNQKAMEGVRLMDVLVWMESDLLLTYCLINGIQNVCPKFQKLRILIGLLLLFSCLVVSDPIDCSTPVFPVLHYLSELAQTLILWVGVAI